MASTTDHQKNQAKASKKTFKCQQYEAVVKETQWPIIYSPEYNIAFCGLERLHPFDAGKWGRIFEYLKEAGMVRDDTIVEPDEATEQELLFVHSKQYLGELRWSVNVAAITEVPPVALLPNFIVQRKVLRPFRFQTSGTIMAGRLALERGWAINIGGGFHHCSATKGGGFCAYADITLCIKFAFEKLEGVAKAMIIDLDAHQGNGHERDFMNDERVFILDVYNRSIYPHDGFAKRAIARKVELAPYTDDKTYLESVRRHVEGALNEFEPHIVVYNAGTDILDGDPLGCLSISAQGIIERDQIVFQKCRTRGIPVLMVTSGGYQRQTARIVADSVLNLHSLGLISCDEAENAPLPELPRRDPADPVPNLSHSRSDGGLFARFRRSCLSRASSSTNSIASLNSPCGAELCMNDVNNDNQQQSTSIARVEQITCDSAFRDQPTRIAECDSAFQIGDALDSVTVEQAAHTTKYPMTVSDVSFNEDACQSGADFESSLPAIASKQCHSTNEGQHDHSPLGHDLSSCNTESRDNCDERREQGMGLLEAFDALKSLVPAKMETQGHEVDCSKDEIDPVLR